jgi:hypothetical protein
VSGAQLFAPVWMSGRRRSQFSRPFPPSRHQNVFSIRLSFDVPLGHVTAFFLFDVSNAIDLQRLRSEIDASVSTRLATKPATPTYLQYQQPPLTLDGAVIGAGEVNGCRVRFKAFDYGVISVALTHALPDTWDQLMTVGPQWQDNPRLAEHAERLCRDLVTRISAAVSARHEPALSEDYVVFTILADTEGSADQLIAAHGMEIARLLRGERETLSFQERDEVLRQRISYYPTDAVIPTWSSALVYDTESGIPGVLEILEFVNSQLLEFRYYDQLLDAELARTYAALQVDTWRPTWLSRRYSRAARHIHSLFIDVNELTDRAENALKIAGDVYAARFFGLAAARIGLDQWKANVRDKLKTVDDIYRFAVEQAAIARGEFLELTVVVLILLEIVLLMH